MLHLVKGIRSYYKWTVKDVCICLIEFSACIRIRNNNNMMELKIFKQRKRERGGGGERDEYFNCKNYHK